MSTGSDADVDAGSEDDSPSVSSSSGPPSPALAPSSPRGMFEFISALNWGSMMTGRGGAHSEQSEWANATLEDREWARGEGLLHPAWRAAPRCEWAAGPTNGMSNAVAVSPDGRLAAAACADCPARVWACADGSLVSQVPPPAGGVVPSVTCLCFCQGQGQAAHEQQATQHEQQQHEAPPLRLYTGWDCDVREWDPLTGARRRALRGHRAHVKQLVAAPSGGVLFSLSEDQSARAWRTADGTCTLILNGPGGAQITFALSGDSRWLFVSTARNSLAVWRTEEGTLHNELEGHESVRALALAVGRFRPSLCAAACY